MGSGERGAIFTVNYKHVRVCLSCTLFIEEETRVGGHIPVIH